MGKVGSTAGTGPTLSGELRSFGFTGATSSGTTTGGFGACPVPQSRYDHILLGHGSGGRLTAELIQRVFLPGYCNEVLAALEDQATLALDGTHNGARGPRIAFTTDSFVVRPLFFPGGDIGKLAVHGTVNDLAVGGAVPRFLAGRHFLCLPVIDQGLTKIVEGSRLQIRCHLFLRRAHQGTMERRAHVQLHGLAHASRLE